MKVCYVANIRLPTEKAHGTQIMKMCEAFARLGHEVELVVPDRNTPITEDPFTYYGVARVFAITRVPTLDLVRFGRFGFLLQTVLFAAAVSRSARIRRADVVFSRDEAVLYTISFMRQVVWESHDGRTNAAARRLVRHAQLVVATTKGIRERYEEQMSPTTKIIVAGNAVDAEALKCADERVRDIRATFAPAEKRIVLYAGRLDGWKGSRTLLDASKQLPRDVQVVIVGGESDQVAACQKEYPHVRFVGFVPYRDLGCYQRAADVLVLPNTARDPISVSRTSPLKLFTYMAAGVPIVASDLPSIREVLGDDACFFVTPDDPAALAKALERVLGDRPEAARRAARAEELVKGHTWDARAREIAGAWAGTM